MRIIVTINTLEILSLFLIQLNSSFLLVIIIRLKAFSNHDHKNECIIFLFHVPLQNT